MRVAVVGGKLQGVEASYLAKKAGWEVVLIDKDQYVPAAGLCDSFLHLDVNRDDELIPQLKQVDLIIPALENKEALASLTNSARQLGIPMIFDPAAYNVSSSKLISNRLFASLNIPAPLPWPQCGFPLIAKPSGASGSEGVVKIRTKQDYQQLKASLGPNVELVIEEYLEGPSFSIEVIGFKGKYKVLQITELHMDEAYDCKRVLAPVSLAPALRKEFETIAFELAKALNLNGIMDVETILHDGKLKVLEIDARLPSQTPTAVFKSTGINIIQLLGEAFVKGLPGKDFEVKETRGVIYEHIKVTPKLMEVSGEHIMADAGPLHMYQDFFGADEVLTNFVHAKNEWVATLIITGADLQEAWEKRCSIIRNIRNEMGIRYYIDPFPAFGERNLKVSNHA